ncbi:heme peroxidase family protein [Caballeronia sp. ATUFL_F1_KS39]|uniref:peroxidase family protein n=1 Tax=Caballeronia sp. ATUFL_F1_KS39 TaxID=2921766 RepID=UPI002029391C|nr:heme peroxidase family protein [Caballeronia sp. ATUFL_F1_KS39]
MTNTSDKALDAHFPSSHGNSNRGLVAGALPGVAYGRFGNMLPSNPARRVPEAAMHDLALAMIKSEDKDTPITEREVVDENPALPAGYTYFGQFVDHDITFDPTPFATAERDAMALTDFRSPALDLDSVYGRGPDDQPYLYEPGTVRLRVGKEVENGDASVGTRNDLFRLDDNTPLLGDKRNDENKIVSQIHGMFIAFHNKVVGDTALLKHFGFDAARPDTRFRAAANLVRWHYQWVVLHDYLERITQPGTVKEILNPGGTPLLRHYLHAEATFAYMPIEFSGAAFRFGHSQVRPSYSLNQKALTPVRSGDLGDPTKGRIPTFARPVKGLPVADGNFQDLNGFPGPVVSPWGIDWSFFLDGPAQPTSIDSRLKGQRQLPQHSYRIDALLVNPLADLPEFFKDTDAGKKDSLIGHLAFRNLLRGQNLGLPSGQRAAAALDIEPLGDDVLWDAGSCRLDQESLDPEFKKELDETRERRRKIKEQWVERHKAFAGNTPLWYYILREAEYFGVERVPKDEAIAFGGQHLGPVGSRIVAETLIGLLWQDKNSILHAHRPFKPLHELSNGRDFTLATLAEFALS